jgi:hypothetical protein
MSEASITGTACPRRTVRSVGAVIASIVAGVLLTIGTDLVRHATGVFPPWGQPMINADAVLLLAAAYRVVYGVAWNGGPTFGPHWYPLALVATAMPCAWLGGKLRIMQLPERPATIRNSWF